MNSLRLILLRIFRSFGQRLGRKPRVHYWPPFEDLDDLNDSVSRACWYLPSIDPQEIVLFSSEGISFVREQYFSSKISSLFESLTRSGVLKICTDTGEAAARMLERADIIVLWRGLSATEPAATALKSATVAGCRVYDVSKSRRMEGSFYIEISRGRYNLDARLKRKNRERLDELLHSLAGSRNAFLLCTGPSLEEYRNFDLSDGVTIACNSVINDEELMSAVRPELIVFADPIFHFGCSLYTEKFLDKLLEVSRRYDFDIVIPDKYYALFVYALPELVDRTYAVSYDNDQPVNLDMIADQRIRTTDNILTFLMLPIASTIAENTRLFGCDGRPLEEDDYFWSHNPKAQFVGEMESIKLAHPSFFKLEYNEYYLRHCETLENYFCEGERRNRRYISMSFSHINALNDRRYAFRGLPGREPGMVVSINPDLRDEELGHFYRYDERLARSIQNHFDFVSLSGKEFERPPGSPLRAIATFTHATWSARRARASALNAWFEELSLKLNEICLRNSPVSLFMYLGSLEHLKKLADSIEALPKRAGLKIHLNLFYAHADFPDGEIADEERGRRYGAVLQRVRDSRFEDILTVYADSQKLCEAISLLTGIKLPLWPMIHILDEDEAEKLSNASRPDGEIVVSCPANGQFAKGFDHVCRLIVRFQQKHGVTYRGVPIRFTLRDLMRDSEEGNEQLRELLNEVKGCESVDVIKGNISESEYTDLYCKSHIVLLPYRKAAFYSRTSACLINALLASNRVLAIKDTWLGDLTEKYGAGVCYADDASEDRILESLEELLDQVIDSADYPELHGLVEDYSPRNLASVLVPAHSA